jgi:hypothetical protein
MTHQDPEDTLLEGLSQLPRTQASEGFTDRVLAAVEARQSNTPRRLARLAWAGAVTLMLGLLVGALVVHQRQRAAELAYQQQVEALRSRYEELLNEVVSIRQEASTPDNRLYLGGDDSLDLMLDLNRLEPNPLDSSRDTRDVRSANWEP